MLMISSTLTRSLVQAEEKQLFIMILPLPCLIVVLVRFKHTYCKCAPKVQAWFLQTSKKFSHKVLGGFILYMVSYCRGCVQVGVCCAVSLSLYGCDWQVQLHRCSEGVS
ncbi:hypothetical protein ILYODFUR_025925 [Ilyodon furcidens]|uniref:Uncharacterized protein n=1 Tax=Ilyodon furcidens TaxID=33524 RepID=A0ABV0V651_9TELE